MTNKIKFEIKQNIQDNYIQCDLKPCPFCGSKANLFYTFYDPFYYEVMCSNVNCVCHTTKRQRTSEKAKELWNNRVG